MARLVHASVFWLLMMVLPFQPLTGAVLDLVGPAHVHAGHRDHADHGHDEDHHHHHGSFDRHHHDHDDPTVVAIGDDGRDDKSSGWSGTLCVVLPCKTATLDVVRGKDRYAPARDDTVRSRMTLPLERPPRLLRA